MQEAANMQLFVGAVSIRRGFGACTGVYKVIEGHLFQISVIGLPIVLSRTYHWIRSVACSVRGGLAVILQAFWHQDMCCTGAACSGRTAGARS